MLNLWRMIQLTLKRRIKLFKSLAISKVIHLLLITKFHNTVKPLNSAHLRFLKKIVRHIWTESVARYSRDVCYVGCLLLGVFTVIQLMLCTKYRKTSFGKGKRQKPNIVLFAMAMKREI